MSITNHHLDARAKGFSKSCVEKWRRSLPPSHPYHIERVLSHSRRSGNRVYFHPREVMWRAELGWDNWDKHSPMNIKGLINLPIWCPTFYKEHHISRPNAGMVFNGVGRSPVSEIVLAVVHDFHFGFNKNWYGTPTLMPNLPAESPEEWEPHPSCKDFFGVQFHEWKCWACAGWAHHCAKTKIDEDEGTATHKVMHTGHCEALLSRNPRHSLLAYLGYSFGQLRRAHECTMSAAPETVTDALRSFFKCLNFSRQYYVSYSVAGQFSVDFCVKN